MNPTLKTARPQKLTKSSTPSNAKKSKEDNVHEGHRERLRTTFVNHGLDVMTDIHVLEFLLFYTNPRKDTNPIAHRLLDTFGSLDGVLSASISDLMSLGGLSENAASLIRLIPDVARRQQISRLPLGIILDTPEKFAQYLLPYYIGAKDECIYLLALDSKCKVIDCSKLATGSVNCAALSTRAVVEYALRFKATSIVMSHNHPSGIATPSQEDLHATRAYSQALNTVSVLLADHIIVAGDDYTSMLQSGVDFRTPRLDASLAGAMI